MANRYFLYQMTPESVWIPGAAQFRDKTISDLKPPFATALDVSSDFTDPAQNTAEFFAGLTYWGDFYADFDGDLEDAAKDVNLYLDKLAGKGVDLNTVKIWATGGRGFHVTIAPTVFNDKERKDGTRGLPLIYREIALALAVDTLDMAVYSTRKGRMWRTENVQRKNGAYKVPITLAETRAMTPELYATLCSQPRHLPPGPPPTPVSGMVELWMSASDKLELRIKNSGKCKADKALITKFAGKVPPTLAAMMRGENLNDKIGFNKIALQLAPAAHALGKTLEEYITLCDGLIQNHKGDGDRYNSPAKRKAELIRLFHYTDGNVGFEFMVGPIKNMLAEGTQTLDLDGISTASEAEVEALAPGEAPNSDAGEKEISQGLSVSRLGVHKRTDEGTKKLTAMGFANPAMLMDSISGETVGYEVNIFCDGLEKGTHVMPIQTFLGRQKFAAYSLAKTGASMSGTDNDVGAIADVMRYRAIQEGRNVYVVGREGLDLVRPLGAGYGHDKFDLIYMSANKCLFNSPQQYRLKPTLTKKLQYNSDLLDAPDLVDSPHVRNVLAEFLNLQSEPVVARLFGWYVAAFLRQVFHELFKAFPLLHLYGEAGTGKTKTCLLFGQLHTYTIEPRRELAGSLTQFALKCALAGSASIPLIVDEWKPRGGLNPGAYPGFRGMKRGCYDQGSTSQGTVDADAGGTDTRSAVFSAPTVFIAEAVEQETALIHRCIVTPFQVVASKSRTATFELVTENKHVISSFGKEIVKYAMQIDINALRALVKKYEVEEVMPRMLGENTRLERPIYNYAVNLAALDFAKGVFQGVFKDCSFDEKIDGLKEALLESLNVDGVAGAAKSEVAKVLSTLAQLSNEREDPRIGLIHGQEFVVGPGYVDIKIKAAFAKYAKYTRAVGSEKLFDSEEAFVAACGNYHGVIDKVCTDSELKTGRFTVVYRFTNTKLDADQVETFKGRSDA